MLPIGRYSHNHISPQSLNEVPLMPSYQGRKNFNIIMNYTSWPKKLFNSPGVINTYTPKSVSTFKSSEYLEVINFLKVFWGKKFVQRGKTLCVNDASG